MRAALVLSAAALLLAAPVEAQNPDRTAAWSACQSWVRSSLHRAADEVRFPTLGTDQVEVQVDGKQVQIRSTVKLRDSDTPEVLAFTCIVEQGGSRQAPPAYGFKRLILPDTTRHTPSAVSPPRA